MTPEIDGLLVRLREQRARLNKQHGRNRYLREHAVETGIIEGKVEYWIVPHPVSTEMKQALAEGMWHPGSLAYMENALNGYVAFPKRHAPLKSRSVFGVGDPTIISHISVHGGITYAVKDDTAMVYGFDTGHWNSEHYPIGDPAFIRWQCRMLYDGILLARKIEPAYLRTRDPQRRVALLKPLLDVAPEEGLNATQILGVLMGRV